MLLWLQAALSVVYALIAVARGFPGDFATDLVIAFCVAGIGLGVWSGNRFGVMVTAAVSAVEILAATVFIASLVVYGKLQFIGLGVVEPLFVLAVFAVPAMVLCVVMLATARPTGADGRVPKDSFRS